ncbi:MAG: SulP family inorganic anion transporter [Candidatus Eremiobacteraeota bacterium]|nr:SulP family inorganic anion transporter [Candidatus Eremiobacteraeota bacterium]
MFGSFARYRPAWLWSDLVAGLLLAAIAIPEQMATARLGGMPAQTGIYAFAAGSLAFAAFGVNRYVSVGADSTIAPIFAGSVAALAAQGSGRYAEFVAAVALFSGVLLIAAGLLRAGWIADFLSIPVTIGFLAGIGAHIVVGQLPLVLGVTEPHGPLLVRLVALLQAFPHANFAALTVGVGVFAVTWGAERLSPRIPGALIGLVGAGVAAVTLRLSERGVKLLGPLPFALPTLRLPGIDIHDALALAPVAFIVALVCVMQTAAVVRLFPSHERQNEDAGPDFTAVGIGCVLSALFGAFAVNASPPRTSLAREAGGRSQLAGVVAVTAIALLVIYFSRLSAALPQAALGGVLVFIGVRIFRTRDMLNIAQRGGVEIWFVVAAALFVIALPIETGMALSVILSLLRGIYIVARPPSVELVHVRGTTIWWPPSAGVLGERVAGIVVFAPGAPIAFTNGQYIAAQLRAAVARAAHPVKLLVIEAGGVIDVDYTGAEILFDTIATLRDAGVDVAIARLSDARAIAAAQRTGLVTAVGEACVFKTVHEAVEAFGGYSTPESYGESRSRSP